MLLITLKNYIRLHQSVSLNHLNKKFNINPILLNIMLTYLLKNKFIKNKLLTICNTCNSCKSNQIFYCWTKNYEK